jgi:oxygen-independent coproporphyrinogen-3 oxidase
MEEVRKLAPENVTVHSLAIKRAARLRIDREAFRDYQMINTPEMIDLTQQACMQMGLFPYYLYRQKNMAGNFENVGYAKPGYEGLYNILMMEELQSVIALGAGTVSKRVWPGGRIERCDTVKDLPSYISRIEEMIERKRKLFTRT